MVIIISSVKLLLFLAAWKKRGQIIRRYSGSFGRMSIARSESSDQPLKRLAKLGKSKHLSVEAASLASTSPSTSDRKKKQQPVRTIPKIRNEFSAVSEPDPEAADVDSSFLQIESCRTSDNHSTSTTTKGSKYISSSSSVTENEV